MCFEVNKLYQTRSGQPARYTGHSYSQFSSFEVQMKGMTNDRGWYRVLRYADGTFFGPTRQDERDIIEITASDEELTVMHRLANANPREFILILRELRNG